MQKSIKILVLSIWFVVLFVSIIFGAKEIMTNNSMYLAHLVFSILSIYNISVLWKKE